jgi:hypothetical protein
MNVSITAERRASERDRQYTPHEHEELRAVVTRWRDKKRQPDQVVPAVVRARTAPDGTPG